MSRVLRVHLEKGVLDRFAATHRRLRRGADLDNLRRLSQRVVVVLPPDDFEVFGAIFVIVDQLVDVEELASTDLCDIPRVLEDPDFYRSKKRKIGYWT